MSGLLSFLPKKTINNVGWIGRKPVIRCVQAVLPAMRERRSECIINISSVAGRICNPPLTAYCASKWALEALSEGLTGEMKTFNVRVALVELGIIDTPWLAVSNIPKPNRPTDRAPALQPCLKTR